MSIDDHIFRRFCSQASDAPFAMHAPFYRSGWKYATDGQICIRVTSAPFESKTKRLPPVENAFGFLDGDAGPGTAWEKFRSITDAQIHIDSHWCPECDGMSVDCVHCGRTGRIIDLAYVMLDGRPFAARYVRMISQLLPLPEYLFTTHGEPPRNRPLSFKFRGGQGALMPLPHDLLKKIGL